MQTGKTNCAQCHHRGQCVWHSLPVAPDIELTPRVYRRGRPVYRAGEPCEGLYVVRSGAIKTYWIGPDGTEQILGFHGPGSVFGVEALAEGKHANHADSLDTSSICVIPTSELLRACASSPPNVLALLQSVSDFAKNKERTQIWLGTHNAEQRLAAFLLEEAESQKARGQEHGDIQLPMARRDIAKHLALAVETLSRLFAKLEASGTVAVDPEDRRRIRIASFERLGAMAAAPEAAVR